MATTRSDIVIPEIFTPYLEEQTTLRSAFLQSGIATPMAELNAEEGGDYRTVPSFTANLSGDAEVMRDDRSATPSKIGAESQRAIIMHRIKAWTSRDLARMAAGADPMAAIGNKAGAWIANQQQKDLLSILDGCFGPLTSNTTGALKDLAVDDGASGQAVLGPSTVARVRATLGDAGGKLTTCCMHSAIYYDLYERKALDFVTAADTAGSFPDSANDAVGGTYQNAFGQVEIPIFMGMRVIVDDSVAAVSGKYAVYFFAPGAIGTGNQQGLRTETDRDILAKEDAMAVDWHNVMHPMGVNYKSTAPVNPDRDQLATASNWDLVWELKNIGIARATVISNFD
jgi:hypothetical protein